MLLCALVLGAWVSPLRADPDGAIDLRVMSFNIRVLNTDDAAENQWTNRIDRVCALIKEVQPDLLGVQEAVPQQYEDVKAGLDGYVSIFAGRDDGIKGEGTPIFYKVPPCRQRALLAVAYAQPAVYRLERLVQPHCRMGCARGCCHGQELRVS